jgi:hypothetical protein
VIHRADLRGFLQDGRAGPLSSPASLARLPGGSDNITARSPDRQIDPTARTGLIEAPTSEPPIGDLPTHTAAGRQSTCRDQPGQPRLRRHGVPRAEGRAPDKGRGKGSEEGERRVGREAGRKGWQEGGQRGRAGGRAAGNEEGRVAGRQATRKAAGREAGRQVAQGEIEPSQPRWPRRGLAGARFGASPSMRCFREQGSEGKAGTERGGRGSHGAGRERGRASHGARKRETEQQGGAREGARQTAHRRASTAQGGAGSNEECERERRREAAREEDRKRERSEAERQRGRAGQPGREPPGGITAGWRNGAREGGREGGRELTERVAALLDPRKSPMMRFETPQPRAPRSPHAPR